MLVVYFDKGTIHKEGIAQVEYGDGFSQVCLRSLFTHTKTDFIMMKLPTFVLDVYFTCISLHCVVECQCSTTSKAINVFVEIPIKNANDECFVLWE